MGRCRALAGVMLLGALTLAGCSSSTALPACSELPCTGVIDGAAYEVVLPDEWNGTLLVYSHGYRNTQPVPPDFAPIDTAPEPAPGWSNGDRALGQALLSQGYALAGSAFAANGWAVSEGVAANRALVEWFRTNVAEPDRVIAWGDSLGGLISTMWGQENPEIDGVLAMCAPLAGVIANMDLAYRAAERLRADIWPQLPVTGFASYDAALAGAIAAAQIVTQLANVPIDPRLTDLTGESGSPLGGLGLEELDLPLIEVPTIEPNPQYVLTLAEELGAPAATRQFDGATPESALAVATESLVTAVTFGTLIRYDLAVRTGGEVGDPEDAAARAAAAGLGQPSGALAQPTIALHTIDDPVTIAANVSVFADRVGALGRTDQFQAWFTAPPAVFPADPGAPYGAGHCNFADDVRIQAVGQLAEWLDSGQAPNTSDDLLGTLSGYQPDLSAAPWPIPLD